MLPVIFQTISGEVAATTITFNPIIFQHETHSHLNPNDKKAERDPVYRLAVYGSLDEIAYYLQHARARSAMQEDETAREIESPVYHACVRGSWTAAKLLLQARFGAVQRYTTFELSCLHWAFAMNEEYQTEAISILMRNGVDIDALASEPMPFPHYPFMLPAGTPPQWAIALSCHNTIQNLVENGADPLTRDGSDPYKWDDTVRNLDKFTDLTHERFSVPRKSTAGQNPFDYGAMQWDLSIFRCILRSGVRVDVNATDEEGFSVLHRLSADPLRRTRLGATFSVRPFQGGPSDGNRNLNEAVTAIVTLEGNLEALTKGPLTEPGLCGKNNWDLFQYIPLMLDVEKGQEDVAKALLEAGASVYTRNGGGWTVMHFVPGHDQESYLDCMKMLCTYGAEIHTADL